MEIASDNGQSLKTAVVKPGREIGLPIRRRRIVVHTSIDSREYLVPGVLHIPLIPSQSNPHYQTIIDGKWRLLVTQAPTLSITYIGEASVYGLVLPDLSKPPLLFPLRLSGEEERMMRVDFSKPPLLFPLRPRKPSETFEHYASDLQARTRSALLK